MINLETQFWEQLKDKYEKDIIRLQDTISRGCSNWDIYNRYVGEIKGLETALHEGKVLMGNITAPLRPRETLD